MPEKPRVTFRVTRVTFRVTFRVTWVTQETALKKANYLSRKAGGISRYAVKFVPDYPWHSTSVGVTVGVGNFDNESLY